MEVSVDAEGAGLGWSDGLQSLASDAVVTAY
jgi:hypothetical protein